MEEKKKGRPRKIPQKQATERYRSDPEDLEKLKEERLERMKKFLHGGTATSAQSDSRDTLSKTDDGASRNDDKANLRADAIETAKNWISEKAAEEIGDTFEGPFVGLRQYNLDFEKLTYAQTEALGKVCHTDELIDDMLNALEEAGANQRWLTAAKASFQCAIMEVYRAVLKPKGI